MDVTRDSSPRPNPWTPPTPPEFPDDAAEQLSRAMANAVTKPLAKPVYQPVPPPVPQPVSKPSAEPTDEVEAQAGVPVPAPAHGPVGATAAGRGRDARAGDPRAGELPSARRPPRGDPDLREYPAFTLPGWLGLFGLLLGLAGAIAALLQAGVIPPPIGGPDIRSAAAQQSGQPVITPDTVAMLCAAAALVLAMWGGLVANTGGQARVLTRWGQYRGTVRRTGLVWVNPLLSRRRVDVRLRHWRSEPVNVTDREGTPIVVRLLVVWRIKDTARAVLGIASHEDYLREQVHAVLTRTASTLPCDSHSAPGPALRDGEWFAEELTRALLAEVAPAGIELYSVQPLALEYAPEVAESVRRRRLADLDTGVRNALVDDAVEAAALAVRRLERATAQQLDESARRALMEQLLVAFVAPAGMPASVRPPAARSARSKEGKSA